MKEDLLKIINHYGIENQKRKFSEEADELRDAIVEYQKMFRVVSPTILNNQYKKHIAEEIADVMVMLEQIRLHYEISLNDIKNIGKQKVKRQLKRMEKENE